MKMMTEEKLRQLLERAFECGTNAQSTATKCCNDKEEVISFLKVSKMTAVDQLIKQV